MASENAEKPQDHDGTSQDAEANGKTPDTDAGRVMAVHVESLRGPEHDDREEVGARDEGDDQGQGQNARFLLQARWEHGKFGPLDFPNGKGDAECSSEEERDEDVSRGPLVLCGWSAEVRALARRGQGTNLVPSPLQSTEEQDHSYDTQEAAHKVNLRNDLPAGETSRVRPRRREVKEEGAKEADRVPSSNEGAAISPASMCSNQLGPEHRRAERNDSKDEDSNVFSSFAGWGQLRGHRKGGEL